MAQHTAPVIEPAADPCVFELVYFARPDSEVFGQSPQAARVRMGSELAEQDRDLPRRISSCRCRTRASPPPWVTRDAAACPSRWPSLQSLRRAHLHPASQDARTHSIRLKLSVVASAVAGKRVLLVDDSLVRGNTAQTIVAMVREAGRPRSGCAWPHHRSLCRAFWALIPRLGTSLDQSRTRSAAGSCGARSGSAGHRPGSHRLGSSLRGR